MGIEHEVEAERHALDLKRFGEAWERVFAACSKLEPDALEALAIIAERLVRGRELHGSLDVEHDGRSWWKELGEEAADGAVYAAFELLRLARSKGA